MEPQPQQTGSRRLNTPMAVLFSASFAIVAVTVLVALWLTGAFLPGWVEWHGASMKVDTNGNREIETVVVSNHHLTIADTADNHYVTPNQWLVSDVAVGDMDGDATPEVVALLWVQEYDDPTYFIPFLGIVPGFSEYIYVFNYVDGAIEPVWHSQALSFDVASIHLDQKMLLTATLANGEDTLWKWDEPGLAFMSADDRATVRVE